MLSQSKVVKQQMCVLDKMLKIRKRPVQPELGKTDKRTFPRVIKTVSLNRCHTGNEIRIHVNERNHFLGIRYLYLSLK